MVDPVCVYVVLYQELASNPSFLSTLDSLIASMSCCCRSVSLCELLRRGAISFHDPNTSTPAVEEKQQHKTVGVVYRHALSDLLLSW